MAEQPASPPDHRPTEGDPFAGTPYRVIQRLASGGMGEIYLVSHRKVGRLLAAKVLHARYAADPRLVDRARIEAQSMARLRHANIVSITGFGTTGDGRPFIVMEYLRGRTLEEELRARAYLPVLEATDLASQLLAALTVAHRLGIVHRDVKPSNLFLCEPHDGRVRLKVLDFGVARVLPSASDSAPAAPTIPTASGVLVGTPRYLSPEGALGRKVDARADLYSTALILYQMLAGRGPFDDAEQDEALLEAHAHREPLAPSRYGAQPIPEALEAIVLKALSKDPDARHQTAQEFREALDQVIAALLCPPALQPTAVIGELPQLRRVLQLAPAPNPEQNVAEAPVLEAASLELTTQAPSRLQAPSQTPWPLLLAVFMVMGLLATFAVLFLERAQ